MNTYLFAHRASPARPMMRHRFFAILTAIVVCSFTFAANAQSVGAPGSISAARQVLIETSLGESYSPDVNPATLSREAWKDFARLQVRSLNAADFETKQRSLQNIIFFATHHGDQVSFKRAADELYYIYRFDDDERIRIMALAALHAVGHDDMMRRVAQHVRLEASPRVRRLTQLALADYFAGERR